MANYECPLAMLTRINPAAVALLSNQLKKKLREQHAAMVSEIETEKEKNKDLVEQRRKEMASSRKAKHTMLSRAKKADKKTVGYQGREYRNSRCRAQRVPNDREVWYRI